MKNFFLEQEKKDKQLHVLTEFIQSNPDPRELKRAIAVKMALGAEPYAKIARILGMHESSISIWKTRFQTQGLEGIKLGYHGSRGYLTAQQQAETIEWLQSKGYWNLEELVSYLDEHYGVIYQSKQSYYTLFAKAGISWKKSQKVNPKSDAELVAQKQEEIRQFLTKHKAEIKSGKMVVLFVDECHLCWGDVCGYVWGKTDIRIMIPIQNERERQTYFGALNYYSKEFIIHEYSAGNGANTVEFVKHLQARYPNQKLALIWDGASYHRSADFKQLLELNNNGLEASEWKVTCIRFAPNAPEQNPVEDVWLQGKNFLRKFWQCCRSFPAVKLLFQFFLDDQKFDFPKINLYTPSYLLT